MPVSSPSPPFRWIDTAGAFADLAATLASAEAEVALDTESDGFHHYFDKLCLLQISTRREDILIDTLNVGSLEPLRPLLESASVTKVLHASEQDLMYLRRDHNLTVRGLFDTLIAAQLIGETRLGLAALLKGFFDVDLCKDNQRDDWSRRPLNTEQLAYAVTDTHHLLALADRLREALAAKGRGPWAGEEFRAQEERSWIMEPVDPDDLTRIKGWKDLAPRNRAILRELLRARDVEARRVDKPPFRVVGNPTLLEIAARPPSSLRELAKVKGLPRFGPPGRIAELLFAAVRTGLEMREEDFPGPPPRGTPRWPSRMDARGEERFAKLKAWRQARAVALGIDTGVVAPQRDLEALAMAPPDSVEALFAREPWTEMRLWRRREFGEEWVRLLAPA